MRSLIAGITDTGHSGIASELPIAEYDVHRSGPSTRIDVFKLTQTPPAEPASTHAAYHDTGLAPGHMDICVLQMPAGVEHPIHYTETLNLHVIVAGSVEVLLDDGPHLLGVGDSLVLPPVDHGWRAGPNGCTQMIMNLGTAKASSKRDSL
jgi:quercetin dioxygenase-like cupin family protein